MSKPRWELRKRVDGSYGDFVERHLRLEVDVIPRSLRDACLHSDDRCVALLSVIAEPSENCRTYTVLREGGRHPGRRRDGKRICRRRWWLQRRRKKGQKDLPESMKLFESWGKWLIRQTNIQSGKTRKGQNENKEG